LADHLVRERHALWIILGKPVFCCIGIGKDLAVILVADVLPRIDIIQTVIRSSL